MTKQELIAENKEIFALNKELVALNQDLASKYKKLASKYKDVTSKYQASIAYNQDLIAKTKEYAIRVETLEYELANLKKLIFGPSSEKRYSTPDANQLSLFDEKEDQNASPQEESNVEVKAHKKKKAKKRKKSCGRNSFPEYLRREVEELLPEDYDPESMVIIGKEETEILAYKKPQVYVRKLVRPKVVVKRDEDQGVKQAPMPPRLIPKGMADESLVAEMIAEKILYHTPIHRFRKKLKQLGVEISSKVLVNWFHTGAEAIMPVYHLMHKDLLSQSYIQVDESTIKVLPKNNKNSCELGYMWVIGVPKLRASLFHFGAGRSQKEGLKLLGNYDGLVQADGYEVYNGLQKRNNYTLTYCMAHARRKFFDAKGVDPPRVKFILNKIGDLYSIEKKAREKNYTSEQRLLLRRKEAIPILAEIENWLQEQTEKDSNKLSNPIERAIRYTHSRWTGLTAYANDGRLEIDNNFVENSIRPVALGRKNYLFAGNNNAAQNLAVLYSIINTANMNNLDPQKYLCWLFNKVVHNKVTDDAVNWLPYNLDQETAAKLST